MTSQAKTPAGPRQAFDALLSDSILVKGGRVTANWMADGRFWFVEDAPENTTIKAFDTKTGKIEPLFDTAGVRAAMAAAIGREPPYRGLPFDSFAPLRDGGAAFSFEGADYVLNAAGDQVARQPDPNWMDTATGMGVKQRTTPGTFFRPSYFIAWEPVPEMLSPDGRWFVGVAENNLYLRSTADGRRTPLTSDGESDYSWDVESVRMRFGPGMSMINCTVQPWSPDGTKLFSTRFDERGGGQVHHLNWLKRTDEVVRTTWTQAGEKLPRIEPHIIDILGRGARRIDVDITEKFLLPVGWTADGGEILLVLYARDMSSAEVVLADAATGTAEVLMTERSDTFLRPQHDVVMGGSGCTLLPGGSGFLWESDRDGFRHIYHHDMDGKLLGQLTRGDWAVLDIRSFDPADGQVYFSAHDDPDRPYDVHLCRVPLAGGKVERLTEGPGIHEVQMAPDFTCFVDTASRPDGPPRSTVRDASGKALHAFAAADISALEAAGWSAPEEFCVKAGDGETDLWGVLYRPRDFDPSRSYPVLEYVYGGPQISVAPHGFEAPPSGMRGLLSALPQLGYVTVVLDARGTPERSKAFMDATYKDWRRHLTCDHAAALRNLARDRPWMDLDRTGIWGFSWGGYTTLACLLDAPDLYRAGVAASPGFDPYSSFLYEPYLGGVPGARNKAAYEDALLIDEAPDLQGRLMLVAGTNDLGVWHDVVKMSNALIEGRKDHEVVMMPGQGHGYGALHETYFIDKLVGHFDRYVKNAGER